MQYFLREWAFATLAWWPRAPGSGATASILVAVIHPPSGTDDEGADDEGMGHQDKGPITIHRRQQNDQQDQEAIAFHGCVPRHRGQATKVARPGGFEPPTCGLEGRCSIQLS